MEGGEEHSMPRGQLSQGLRWAGAWLKDTALLTGAPRDCRWIPGTVVPTPGALPWVKMDMSLELEVEPLDFFHATKLVGLWAIIRGITRSVSRFLSNRLSSEDLLPTTESALRGFGSQSWGGFCLTPVCALRV